MRLARRHPDLGGKLRGSMFGRFLLLTVLEMLAAIFVASGLANLALNVNPFKTPQFPGAAACFAHASKVVLALFLAVCLKEAGHPYWAWIIGDLALGLALGQAFNLYQPFESRSRFAVWHANKMNVFADATIAGLIATGFTGALGLILKIDGLDVFVTVSLAALFLFGKLGVALAVLRQHGPFAVHNGMVSIAKRLIVSLIALSFLGALLAGLLAPLAYKGSFGERLIAFFIGALLAFL